MVVVLRVPDAAGSTAWDDGAVNRERVHVDELDVSAHFETGAPLVVLRGPAVVHPRSREERRETGRLLVGRAASLLLGVEVRDVRVSARCARCGGEHGRPLVSVSGRTDRVTASVSHAGGTTVAAVSDRDVGIDGEPIAGRDDRFAAIRTVVGPSAEGLADGMHVLSAWTTVEAVVKADGRGLEVDARRVRVEHRPGTSTSRAAIDGVEPFYTVSSAVLDGLVLTVAVLDAATG
jgi:4'-phosphopantetheinyl transferase